MQRRRDGLRKARAEKAGKTSKADEAKKVAPTPTKKDDAEELEEDDEKEDAEEEVKDTPKAATGGSAESREQSRAEWSEVRSRSVFL